MGNKEKRKTKEERKGRVNKMGLEQSMTSLFWSSPQLIMIRHTMKLIL